jgi:calcineurin-like phosphoesterase family protein
MKSPAGGALLLALGVAVSAQQAAPTVPPVAAPVVVRAIEPPDRPLPAEAASAGVTRFSFVAYGDTRGQADGVELQTAHGLVVDAMLEKIRSLASTPFPVRFVVQSGDAVARGIDGAAWNVSFTPIVERITRTAGVPFFLAVGNHDVTGMPAGDPGRMPGLRNALAATSKLIPHEGSPRRLSGYPTYAFGYGNVFVIVLDSNIASDTAQLTWVANELEHLDRARFKHVVAVFHHPVLSSGPHGGVVVEPPTLAMRDLYEPLFRRHHVRMTITGHDHLLDHWVQRYDEKGTTYRMDDIVTGGGGAPIYSYSGEPDLQAYLAAGSASALRVEHLMKPGPTITDNPHHFVVVQVDGDRLSLEVVGIAGTTLAPYAGQSHILLSDRVS